MFIVFSIKCEQINGLLFITILPDRRFICLFFALVWPTTMRKISFTKYWQFFGLQNPSTITKDLSVVRWMEHYHTTIGKDILLIFSLFLPTTIRRVFCILSIVSRWITCYLTIIDKGFCCLFTLSPPLRQKCSQKYGTCPSSLVVGFSKASNHSLVRLLPPEVYKNK